MDPIVAMAAALGRELERRLSAVEQSASLWSAREFVNKVQARLGTIEGIDEVLEQLAVDADPDYSSSCSRQWPVQGWFYWRR